MIVKVPISFEITYELWEKLFIAAIDGGENKPGVSYWASVNCRTASEIYPDEPFSVACAKYFWDGVQHGGEAGGGMFVHAHDGNSRILFFDDFITGITKCIEDDYYRDSIISGDMNTGIADAWFQYSCYSEQVYE